MKRRVGKLIRNVKTASCRPIKNLCSRKKCKPGSRCRVTYRFTPVTHTVTRVTKVCPCNLVKTETPSRKAELVDMAFVVDTTGSMGRVIDGIRTNIKQIVAANKGTIRKFVIAPFNDPMVGPVTVSTESSTIFDAVNRLKASGGGDCPEMSMKGILEAATKVKVGSVIYVFTDASAKDFALRAKVRNLVTKKKLQVIFLITGHLCGRNYHKEYQYLSSGNGQVITLKTDRIHKVLSFIREAVTFGSDRLKRLNVSRLDKYIRKCSCHNVKRRVTRKFYRYKRVAKCTSRKINDCKTRKCSKGFRCVRTRTRSRRGTRNGTRCVRIKQLCGGNRCQNGYKCVVRYLGLVLRIGGRKVKMARRKATCVKPETNLCSNVRCGRFRTCVVRRKRRGAPLTARCIDPTEPTIKCGRKMCRRNQKCVTRKSNRRVRRYTSKISRLKRAYLNSVEAENRRYDALLRAIPSPRVDLGQQDRHACEHESLGISCPDSYIIQVVSGFYGRTSNSYCARGPRRTFSCSSGRASGVISSMCNNRQSCNVQSSNSVFGDPCVGTFKYMTVRYRCRLAPDVETRYANQRSQLTSAHNIRLRELQIRHNKRLAAWNVRVRRAKRGLRTCVSTESHEYLCSRKRCAGTDRCVLRRILTKAGRKFLSLKRSVKRKYQTKKRIIIASFKKLRTAIRSELMRASASFKAELVTTGRKTPSAARRLRKSWRLRRRIFAKKLRQQRRNQKTSLRRLRLRYGSQLSRLSKGIKRRRYAKRVAKCVANLCSRLKCKSGFSCKHVRRFSKPFNAFLQQKRNLTKAYLSTHKQVVKSFYERARSSSESFRKFTASYRKGSRKAKTASLRRTLKSEFRRKLSSYRRARRASFRQYRRAVKLERGGYIRKLRALRTKHKKSAFRKRVTTVARCIPKVQKSCRNVKCASGKRCSVRRIPKWWYKLYRTSIKLAHRRFTMRLHRALRRLLRQHRLRLGGRSVRGRRRTAGRRSSKGQRKSFRRWLRRAISRSRRSRHIRVRNRNLRKFVGRVKKVHTRLWGRLKRATRRNSKRFIKLTGKLLRGRGRHTGSKRLAKNVFARRMRKISMRFARQMKLSKKWFARKLRQFNTLRAKYKIAKSAEKKQIKLRMKSLFKKISRTYERRLKRATADFNRRKRALLENVRSKSVKSDRKSMSGLFIRRALCVATNPCNRRRCNRGFRCVVRKVKSKFDKVKTVGRCQRKPNPCRMARCSKGKRCVVRRVPTQEFRLYRWYAKASRKRFRLRVRRLRRRQQLGRRRFIRKALRKHRKLRRSLSKRLRGRPLAKRFRNLKAALKRKLRRYRNLLRRSYRRQRVQLRRRIRRAVRRYYKRLMRNARKYSSRATCVRNRTRNPCVKKRCPRGSGCVAKWQASKLFLRFQRLTKRHIGRFRSAKRRLRLAKLGRKERGAAARKLRLSLRRKLRKIWQSYKFRGAFRRTIRLVARCYRFKQPCPSGYTREGKTCVKFRRVCPRSFIMIRRKNRVRCIKFNFVCKKGRWMFNNRCWRECPKGTTRASGRKCKLIKSCSKFLRKTECVSSCPKNFITVGRRCRRCPRNSFRRGNGCFRRRVYCRTGFSYRARCVKSCPKHTYANGKKCMRARCPPGSVQRFSTRKGKVVCVRRHSCLKGQVYYAGTCKSTCPSGTQRHRWYCLKICRKGLRRVGFRRQRCIREYCYNRFRIGRSCVRKCPIGYIGIHRSCRRVDISCPKGFMKLGRILCLRKCPAGFTNRGKRCEYSTCKKGTFRFRGSCVKVCPAGSRRTGSYCFRRSKCRFGRYAYESLCLSKCPPGHYRSVAKRACLRIKRCGKGLLRFRQLCLKSCPLGFEMRRRSCRRTYTCRNGNLYKGVCIITRCPSGTRAIRGACVPTPRLCPSGLLLLIRSKGERSCVRTCPRSFAAVRSLGTCRPTRCPRGTFRLADKCIKSCPKGFRARRGYCKEVRRNCKAGLLRLRRRCVKGCPSGFKARGGRCRRVKRPDTCGKGTFRFRRRCVKSCPKGFTGRVFRRRRGAAVRFCRPSRSCGKGRMRIYRRRLDRRAGRKRYSSTCVNPEKPCKLGFVLKRRLVRFTRKGRRLRRVLRLCKRAKETCAKGLFMYQAKCRKQCPRGMKTLLVRRSRNLVRTCKPKCGTKFVLKDGCTPKCPSGYSSKRFGSVRFCKKECPKGRFSFKNACISRCPSGYRKRTYRVYSRSARKIIPITSCEKTKCDPGYKLVYRLKRTSTGRSFKLTGVCRRERTKTCRFPTALAFGRCFRRCPAGYRRRTRTVRGRRLGFCRPTRKTVLCRSLRCDKTKICVLVRQRQLFTTGKRAIRRTVRKAICAPRFCEAGTYRHRHKCVKNCPRGFLGRSARRFRVNKGRRLPYTVRLCAKKICKYPMTRFSGRCVKSCPTTHERKVFSFRFRYRKSRFMKRFAVCRRSLCSKVRCASGQKCVLKAELRTRARGRGPRQVAACISDSDSPCESMKCRRGSKCQVKLVSGRKRAACIPSLVTCRGGFVLFRKSCQRKCPKYYRVLSKRTGRRLYRRCVRDACTRNRFFTAGRCVQRCPSGFVQRSIKYSKAYVFKYCMPRSCKRKLFRLGDICLSRCPAGYRRRYFKTRRGARRFCVSSTCAEGTLRLGKACVKSCPSNYSRQTIRRGKKVYDVCVPKKCTAGMVFVDGRCRKARKGCYDKTFACKIMARRKQCSKKRVKLLCPVACGSCNPKDRKLCTCTTMGVAHYRTFDGHWMSFLGKCRYLLAESKIEKSKCNFTVTAKNEDRGKRRSAKNLAINIHGLTIRLHRNRRVFLNRKRVPRLPISLYKNGMKIRVYRSGKNVVAESKYCGLYLEFNGRTVAQLHLPKSHFGGKVRGICGNCNGDPKDDLKTREGKDVSKSGRNGFVEIGRSYLVSDGTTKKSSCAVKPAPTTKCSRTMQRKIRKNAFCGLIKDRKGPFHACLNSGKVNFRNFFKNCQSDVCRARTFKNRREAACQSLEALYNDCVAKGFRVSWRTGRFCPMKCPTNAVYRRSTSGCPRTCADLGRRRTCRLPAREGCVCKEGFVLNGKKCVPEASCGKVVPIDLAFVVDGTDDVTPDEFEALKELIIKLLTKYSLSFHSVRPAIAVFGRTNPTLSLFSERPEKSDFMAFVRKLKKSGGSADNLDAALRITNLVIMKPIGGARPDVPKFIILIQKSTVPASSESAVRDELESLKKANVRMIIISLPPSKPGKSETGVTVIPARMPPYIVIPEITKELEKTAGCLLGFAREGERCVDVNECSAKVSPCHPDSTCINVPGSFICLCREGFRHDKTRGCVSEKEECPVKPKCLNGYILDEALRKCVDIDECKENPCLGKDSTCFNTPGSFKCNCTTGFEYNRHFGCIDIDECKNGDPCAGAGKCINTLGAFKCTCDDGYTYKAGAGCLDIDECKTGSHSCKGNSTCVNTIGSYNCTCGLGFRYTRDDCVDIDECAENSTICDIAVSACVNLQPGYKCQCKLGDNWVYIPGKGCVPDETKGTIPRMVDFIFTIDGSDKLKASEKDIQDFLVRLMTEFTAKEMAGLSVRASAIVASNGVSTVKFSQADLPGIESKVRTIEMPGGNVSLLESLQKASEEKAKARKGSTSIVFLITSTSIKAGDVTLPRMKRYADDFKATGKFFTIQISPAEEPADWSFLYATDEISRYVTVIRSSEIITIHKLIYRVIYPLIGCPAGFVKVDSLCQLQTSTLRYCKTDDSQLRLLGSTWQEECSEFKCGESGIEVMSRKCLGFDGQCYSTEEYFPCTQVAGTLDWKCRCKLSTEKDKTGKKVESLKYQSIAASTEVVMTEHNRPCVFPFKYQNRWYYNCDEYSGRYWCSYNRFHETGSWGYCNVKESKNRCTDPFTPSKIYMEGERWNQGCNVMECTNTGLKRIPKCEAADKTCKALNEDGYSCRGAEGTLNKNCICVQDSSGWGKNEVVSGEKAKEISSSGGALVSVCVDRSTSKRYEQGQEWTNSCFKYRCTATGGQLLDAACQQRDGGCRKVGEKGFDCAINGENAANCECAKDEAGNPMLTATVTGRKLIQVLKVSEVKTTMEAAVTKITS